MNTKSDYKEAYRIYRNIGYWNRRRNTIEAVRAQAEMAALRSQLVFIPDEIKKAAYTSYGNR